VRLRGARKVLLEICEYIFHSAAQCCVSIECSYMLTDNLLQQALSCEVREVVFLIYIYIL
jgi:hypothetical protein